MCQSSPRWLCRLVVDRKHLGKGYGRFLLADALVHAVMSEIATFAVVVDAKNETSRRFYERESFLPFLDQPMKLFRPMADIAPFHQMTEKQEARHHGEGERLML